MYILAIDQGTTGSRAIVYDKKGNRIASAYKEFPQYFPKPGWVEHDPEEIWESVNWAIQQVLKKVSPTKIAAIGITNQRETTVVWDKKTGKPVYNAIVWQCRRTAQRCEDLKRNGKGEFIRKRTGLPIDAYFSATKIEWILGKNKEQRAKSKGRVKGQGARVKGLAFGNTDSWILWKLTGGMVHATDPTNASRTMLFNIRKMKWDKDLMKLFNVPAAMMPEVKPSAGVFGYTKKTGKLPAGIPIAGIAGDQQAALFGQTCFYPGELKNTYGTGCFILMNMGKKFILSKHELLTTVACDADGKPAYALEGSIFIAGAAIQWLRDGLKIIEKAPESEKMALSLKDNEGVYFVPALVGLGAPYWDSEARGTITGITRGTKRAHLVRAALEAMCYSTKEVIDLMRRDSGLRISELRIDGGAVANNFLCQFQADILQKRVVRPKIIETTSLGAAYLAILGTRGKGQGSRGYNIKKNWSKDKEFKPKMKKADADRYYKGWGRAVSRTLS